ncbi:MAG: hypothetical protein IJX06_00140 [Clostridia bacterium]|nr:hypothetical protein [Clostridia bacterium]
MTLKARADFTGAKLYITANNFYRLCVDGKFVSFGPARTAKGYARVDIIDLSAFSEGEITIEVAGYACRSLFTVKASSFVTAKLRKGSCLCAILPTLKWAGSLFRNGRCGTFTRFASI